jgi:simple sugar transport system permease protein
MIEDILNVVFLTGLLAATVRLATPVLLAGLGETISQLSGVFDLGIEGSMLAGAFGGFTAAYFTGNIWIGVLAGMMAGALAGLILSFMAVTLRANQAISGAMIGALGLALSGYFLQVIYGVGFANSDITFQPISIPLLSEIPVIGPALFQQNIMVYIAVFLVGALTFVLYRTMFGLKIIAVGENPRSADTQGINVYLIRYISVIIGGMLIGLAGSYITLAYIPILSEGIISGRGYIALALVSFGRWDPRKLLAGTLIFSFMDALQLRLQNMNIGVPAQFLAMLPYILTLVILISARGSKTPKSLGRPYKRD